MKTVGIKATYKNGILEVRLDKRFRGQGLIYEMLDLVEEFVKTNYSNRELYLHVNPENLNALEAYEKHGYQKICLTDKARFKMRKVLN